MRRQFAVYWERTGSDHHGKPVFASPVEIRCRWVEGAGEFRTGTGEMIMYQAKVYVDRAMKVGDVIKRGEMESNVLDNPALDKKAFPVQRIAETPNLRATETLYVIFT